ncbi:MAG: N-acetylglucosamine-6-phosphate deacetylase [Bacteroidetes bacterium]|nr:N-acetylglucosamine-6-phosphate deacetylase [Bacteroidota bacterium]
MEKNIVIRNCALFNSAGKKEFSDIKIVNGKISEIKKSNVNEHFDEVIIDAEGKIAAPGFIDVHIQGAGGADVLDNNKEALETISKTLAKTGTTGFLGTTVVKPQWGNSHLKLMNEFMGKNLGGAALLGIHLEGPFINIKKKGGLAEDSIYESYPNALEEIFEAAGNSLKMMTIAPELPGNLENIKKLRKHGAVASFAHSDATYEETIKGFEAGINHVTHIFNAMPPLNHRTPGPLAAIFENKEIPVQIISDGHHLHPSIVNLIYRLVGKDRCICITDGMHGIGLPDGIYTYNGKQYESKGGAARYFDGTLIGSTMSLGNIALKFMEFTGCNLETAINTITKNPAKLLGIDDRKGAIEIGKDADIVLFDEDFSIYMTLVAGEIVYKK